MTERDFKVAKGLEVGGGNLTLESGFAKIDNVTIDGSSITTTGTNQALTINPDGTGTVTFNINSNVFSLPTTSPSANQILKVNPSDTSALIWDNVAGAGLALDDITVGDATSDLHTTSGIVKIANNANQATAASASTYSMMLGQHDDNYHALLAGDKITIHGKGTLDINTADAGSSGDFEAPIAISGNAIEFRARKGHDGAAGTSMDFFAEASHGTDKAAGFTFRGAANGTNARTVFAVGSDALGDTGFGADPNIGMNQFYAYIGENSHVGDFFKVKARNTSGLGSWVDALSITTRAGKPTVAIDSNTLSLTGDTTLTGTLSVSSNLTVTGDLTIAGSMTEVKATEVLIRDKALKLGIPNLVTADYRQGNAADDSSTSGTVVTIDSTGHGFVTNDYVYVTTENSSGKFNDGIHQITRIDDDTFTIVASVAGTQTVVTGGVKHAATKANNTDAVNAGLYLYNARTVQDPEIAGGLLPEGVVRFGDFFKFTDNVDGSSGFGWALSGDLRIVGDYNANAELWMEDSSGTLASVLSYNTLGSTVTASSLTSVGTLTALQVDNINVNGNAITSTNTDGNITLTPNGAGLVNIAKDDLAIAGTAVTTTAAEINVLDGVTAGQVTADKALVVDASKNLTDSSNHINNLLVENIEVSTEIAVGSYVLLANGHGIREKTLSSQTVADSGTLNIYTHAYNAARRTLKFIVEISDGTDFDIHEVLMTYKGASAPANTAAIFLTTYGQVSTGSALGTIDAIKDGTNIQLRLTNNTGAQKVYATKVMALGQIDQTT
tara:strand:- start:287 stop:2635 length:2349 start_codon:yes stop_codon:yes gene_type:complete